MFFKKALLLFLARLRRQQLHRSGGVVAGVAVAAKHSTGTPSCYSGYSLDGYDGSGGGDLRRSPPTLPALPPSSVSTVIMRNSFLAELRSPSVPTDPPRNPRPSASTTSSHPRHHQRGGRRALICGAYVVMFHAAASDVGPPRTTASSVSQTTFPPAGGAAMCLQMNLLV